MPTSSVGRRALASGALAAWIARRVLGEANPPLDHRQVTVEHADCLNVGILPEKTQILIDQVREVIAEFSLTSHHGGAKVAIISPADRMNNNSFNSLLKTLEEPAGDSCLLLVADRLHPLPATVLSRCSHLKIGIPAHDASAQWLTGELDNADPAPLLRLAGGAPLRALRYVRERHYEEIDTLEAEFAALAAGTTDPVAVAANWTKKDIGFILEWLVATVGGLVRRCVTGVPQDRVTERLYETVGSRVDIKNLFCYQDRLMRLQSQPPGPRNDQLALEALLIEWSNGLPGESAEAALVPVATGTDGRRI